MSFDCKFSFKKWKWNISRCHYYDNIQPHVLFTVRSIFHPASLLCSFISISLIPHPPLELLLSQGLLWPCINYAGIQDMLRHYAFWLAASYGKGWGHKKRKKRRKGKEGEEKKRKAVILVVRWMAEVAQIQAALSSILEWDKCRERKKPDGEQMAAWFGAWAGESERGTYWKTVGQTDKNEEQRNEGEAWSCTEEMHNPIPQLPSWYPDQDGESEKRNQRQKIHLY